MRIYMFIYASVCIKNDLFYLVGVLLTSGTSLQWQFVLESHIFLSVTKNRFYLRVKANPSFNFSKRKRQMRALISAYEQELFILTPSILHHAQKQPPEGVETFLRTTFFIVHLQWLPLYALFINMGNATMLVEGFHITYLLWSLCTTDQFFWRQKWNLENKRKEKEQKESKEEKELFLMLLNCTI